MKKLIFSIILFAFYIASPSGAGGLYAQSTEIKPGSVLPQMTTAQRTALAAVNGMLVFDTNTQSYWAYQSGTWTNLAASGGGGSSYWSLNGLAGNEIKNTNIGGIWSSYFVGLTGTETDITTPPTAPISGPGTRMMWIPARSAFRAGTINNGNWDPINIGLFSFANGFNTIAKGSFSTSLGESTISRGNHSVAIGTYNIDNLNGLFMVGNGDNVTRKTSFIVRKDNDRVGIGLENPDAPLHVAGFNGTTWGQSSFFSPNTIQGTFYDLNLLINKTVHSLSSNITNIGNVGILSDYGIVSKTVIGAAQSVVSSDSRIKKDFSLTNNTSDLALLKKIEITDYRMKDVATWGNQKFKKVIAQQVEGIYPEAIKKQTAVIPDIYTLAESVSYDAAKKQLTVNMAKNYDIKITDKLELVHPEKGKIQAEVIAVSGKSFTVKDWNYAADKIFVFGREVSDFRSVDYEALSMLGISAIQALAKEVEELQNTNKQLQIINNQLLTRNNKIEARLDTIENVLKSNVPTGK